MKTLTGIVMIFALGVFASAQQQAKVVAELAASAEKIVKNSPFSAEAVSESVQTLPDGNRIVHSSTSKLYRNSEGRFRRETTNGSGGMLGSVYSYGPGITILDPVAGQRWLLDTKLMTAHSSTFRLLPELRVKEFKELTQAQKELGQAQKELSETQKALINEKINTELKVTNADGSVTVVTAPQARVITGAISGTINGTITMATPAIPAMAPLPPLPGMERSKYETRSDDLGTQNIEGVEAKGTRTTTTIPAGAIGNERPIEIVYERWYSPDLQLVVMSKHSDPRFGEQTYRLTNINRNEPDPSLFSLPTGYKIVSGNRTAYKVSTAKMEAEKAATIKAARSSVNGIKP